MSRRCRQILAGIMISFGVALSPAEGQRAYWAPGNPQPAERVRIRRANLDGSESERVIYAPPIRWDPALDLRVPMDCSFVACLTGPGGEFGAGRSCADENGDRVVDLSDFSVLQNTFTPLD